MYDLLIYNIDALNVTKGSFHLLYNHHNLKNITARGRKWLVLKYVFFMTCINPTKCTVKDFKFPQKWKPLHVLLTR